MEYRQLCGCVSCCVRVCRVGPRVRRRPLRLSVSACLLLTARQLNSTGASEDSAALMGRCGRRE